MRDEHFSPERYGVPLLVVPSAASDAEGPTVQRAVKQAVRNRAGCGLLLSPDRTAVQAARAASSPDSFCLDVVEIPLDVRDYDARYQRAFLHLAAHLLWRSLLIVRESDYRSGYASLLRNVVPRLCAHRDPSSTPPWLRVKPVPRS